MPRITSPVLLCSMIAAQDAIDGERKLATIPKDLRLQTTSTGPDGSQHTDNAGFAFGADGAFVAYSAYRGGKSVAMAGDEELGEFHYLHAPVMDVTASHYAFRAGNRTSPTKEKWWAIVDGKKNSPSAWIGSVAVSSTGQAVYWEQPGAKITKDGSYNMSSMVFHFGKNKGKKFEGAISLIEPMISADGKTAVSAARRGGQWFTITATARKQRLGKRGYQMVEDAVISADGKKAALVVVEGGIPMPPGAVAPPGMKAGTMSITVDGKLYGDETDGAGAPVFAAKGKRFAFKFVQGDKMGIALDNERKPKAEYDFVGLPVFDAKGKTIAFAINTGGTVSAYARLQRWGAQAVKGGTWSLLTRKDKGKPEPIVEDAEGIAHPVFGPAGQLAFAQKIDGNWHIVVGEVKSDPFDHVATPTFATDQKSVAFGARSDRELWWRVLELQ